MKRLLKEPLLHFLLLGALIFGAYGMVSKRSTTEPGQIVITQGQIENMAAGFTRTWQRPPTPEELTGLVRDRVREEVYCREAIAMGLDKDDTVIRRRLRQKMEFVSDDIAAQTEPTEVELNAYLHAHAEKFRTEARFTFRQVYLNPEKHGARLAGDAAQLLTQLQQGEKEADVAAMSDSFLLDHDFESASAGEVAKQFGAEFAEKLVKLTIGQWQGPIESGYGVHLVNVSQRTEGHLPAVAEVGETVKREWANARRVEANEAFYQDLLKRYVVTIEKPSHLASEAKLVRAK